jgi:Omp85 superfamily domain
MSSKARAPWRRSGTFAAAATAAGILALTAGQAEAQGGQGQSPSQIQTATDVSRGISPLVVPLPVSDPALGSGVVAAGALFYSPVKGGRQWVTGIGGLYTNNKDWGVLVLQQADLMNGRLRISGAGGYGDFNLDFFGVGQAAGAHGVSIKLNEKGEILVLNGLYQVSGKFFLGARYRYLNESTSLAEPLFPDHPILPDSVSLTTRISGLGPAFEYDSRDVQFNPRRGLYVQGQWLIDRKGIGSTFNYDKLTVAANGYLPLTSKTVLALRASLCSTSDGAPFYDLCFYGSGHDLRGYEGGQYRDHAMVVGQAEVRQKLFWRFGAVAFAGVGTIGDSFSRLGDAPVLPAGGVGLRFQPSKKLPVNVSVDYAWGSHSSGLYLYIGEAF